MSRLFGTDGIRGVAGVAPLDAETVFRVGKALAKLIQRDRPRLLVGRDTRESGPMIVQALAEGAAKEQAELTDLGIVPTPGVAYLVKELGYDGAVMVSASHNPFQDNGIKVFDSTGSKIPDEMEQAIEEEVRRTESLRMPTQVTVVARAADPELVERYVAHLRDSLDGTSLRPFRIVADYANGAGYLVGGELLRSLGLHLTEIGNQPDGQNINRECGSTHIDNLAARVVDSGAELGAALDGDGDRLLLVDAQGRLVDGDAIMLLCARRLKSEDRLNGNTVVATVMSNLSLQNALKQENIQMLRTPVGDRFVAEEMRAHQYRIGGEQSGHVIFSEYASTGDGLLTLVQVLRVLSLENKPLEEIGYLEPSPQCLVNVRVKHRPEVATIPAIASVVTRVEHELGDGGRLLIRYSGTEPLLRIMIEGNDQNKIREWAESIADATRNSIGA